MNASQKSEALRLADKYEAHGFLGDHRFAKDHWCTQAAAELRSQHARIAELEAQLSAIAHTAEGATAQTETLRAELADETEAAENWRRIALQFDNHRLQALGHLKAILHPDSSVDEYKTAELFLKAPPLDGESVLAQRIAKLSAAATQAQEDAPVGFAWSGWACMYPGKLPRLYGALEIASVNLDAANGDQLIHLSTSPDPKAQADAQDTDRWMGIGKAIERACADLPEETEIIVSLEKDAGTVTLIDQDGNEHENFSTDYGFAGVLNEAIDAAMAAQAKQRGAA